MEISKKDALLLRELKKNNQSALIQIYDSYWLPLYTYTYSLLTNKEDSEEIVQNIFISLWKNRGKLKIETSLKSYLYTSCRYQAFHLIRKKSSEKMRYAELAKIFEKKIDSNSPESMLIYKELIAKVDDVIEIIPRRCKRVFLLSRKKQLTHKEISKKLKISTKTVEKHITKSISILKKLL